MGENGDRVSRRRFLAGAAGTAVAAMLAACSGSNVPSDSPSPSVAAPTSPARAAALAATRTAAARPPGVVTAGSAAVPTGAAASAVANAPNGAKVYDWLLTGRGNGIVGFADHVSANRGEPVTLYIRSATDYAVEVYRLGWYDKGASAATFVVALTKVPVPIVPQPVAQTDPTTGLVSAANWSPGPTLDTRDWIAGLYLCKLLADDGTQSYIPLVVRDDTVACDVLFVHASNTDQAYNAWGGRSLYEFNSSGPPTATGTVRAAKVSFDRPYDDNSGSGRNILKWELNMVRWLEREGFSVGYAAESDVHANPGGFDARARAIVMAGHSEYWSRAMRDGLEGARDRGRGLGFFTGDTGAWAVRFEESPLGANRVLVCYKDAVRDPVAAQDPASATTLWSNPPLNRPTHLFLGVGTNGPVRRSADWTVAGAAAEPTLFADTGLADGDTVKALVGYEYDGMWTPGAGTEPLPGLRILGMARVASSRPVPQDLQFSAQITFGPASRAPIGRLEMSIDPLGRWILNLRLVDGPTTAYLEYIAGTDAPRLANRGGVSYGILSLGDRSWDPGWQPVARDLRADYAATFGHPPSDTMAIDEIILFGGLRITPIRLTASGRDAVVIPVEGMPNGAQWTSDGEGQAVVENGGPQGEKVLALHTALHDRRSDIAHTVIVRAAGKGPVVAAGTMQWSWALDDVGTHVDNEGQLTPVDGRVQAFTRNVVRTLLRQ